MATEKPINLEQFFITRNEIASRHNNKLELQAMARVNEHLIEVRSAKAKQVQAEKQETTKQAKK